MAASTSAAGRMLSSCTCAIRRSATRIQTRQVHSRPKLPYSIEAGAQPFLSPQALKGTAIEWHQGCLDKLNDLARGTSYENKSVARTVVDAAKTRNDALIFSYASEALNNAYFLSCLTPTPDKNLQESDISRAISASFGSPTSFIDYFSSYAMGMFGSGYVWLVMDAVDNLAVVGTYGAGTVLVQGTVHSAKESEFEFVKHVPDVAVEDVALDSEVAAAPATTQEDGNTSATGAQQSPTATASFGDLMQRRAFHATAQRNYIPSNMGNLPGASSPSPRSDGERFKSIHPILCLSLQPHVYIPDYGICGKEEYIRKFWGNVDWQRCFKRYDEVQIMHSARREVEFSETGQYYRGHRSDYL